MNSTPLYSLSLEPVERQTWSQTEGGKIAALLLSQLIEELGFNLHPKELASILALNGITARIWRTLVSSLLQARPPVSVTREAPVNSDINSMQSPVPYRTFLPISPPLTIFLHYLPLPPTSCSWHN